MYTKVKERRAYRHNTVHDVYIVSLHWLRQWTSWCARGSVAVCVCLFAFCYCKTKWVSPGVSHSLTPRTCDSPIARGVLYNVVQAASRSHLLFTRYKQKCTLIVIACARLFEQWWFLFVFRILVKHGFSVIDLAILQVNKMSSCWDCLLPCINCLLPCKRSVSLSPSIHGF